MAEQKSVGRTLDYSLKGDTLNRVKDATKATANVELQKLKGVTGMLDTITMGAYAIGESVDRGREKTKELNKMWDDAISRGEWATPEAMENFKTMVNTDKEAYIEAVRTGKKEEKRANRRMAGILPFWSGEGGRWHAQSIQQAFREEGSL